MNIESFSRNQLKLELVDDVSEACMTEQAGSQSSWLEQCDVRRVMHNATGSMSEGHPQSVACRDGW